MRTSGVGSGSSTAPHLTRRSSPCQPATPSPTSVVSTASALWRTKTMAGGRCGIEPAPLTCEGFPVIVRCVGHGEIPLMLGAADVGGVGCGQFGALHAEDH